MLPLRLLLVLLSCAGPLHAANLLAFFTVPSRSHASLGRVYLEALAARGHQVTVLTPFKSDSPPRNVREIIVPSALHLMGTGTMNLFETPVKNPFFGYFFLAKFGINVCDFLLKDTNVQQLYNSNEKFDAVVVEDFCQDCFQIFAHKFNAPMIHIVPYEGSTFVGDKMGNPAEIAYVPDPMLAYSDHMDFLERLYNTVIAAWGRLVQRLYYLPAIDAIVRKELNDPTAPSISDIMTKTSLMLINSHVSISYPRPLLPNMVHVGGYHIKPPKKLPEDLQKYLDDAKDGVIYFSMGSNLKSADMPEEKRAVFLRAFSRLKQKVVWKWEAEQLPDRPPNVLVRQWLPQSDILAHKNVKLFITHGGLLSTLETVQRGIPLIALPIYGDQNLNANRAVRAGYALKLDFPNVTDESLQWAISEMLDNPRYAERARQLSRIFQDRPRPPLEEAVFWTEYVIRHQGAQHLRCAALDLAWYQYLLLDVVALVLAAAVLVALVVFLLARAACRALFGRSTKAPAAGKKSKSKKKD